MFEVYVKETHPDMHPDGQAESFEERIEMYEEYRAKYNMTVPALIDDMQNTWKELYLPGPTSCTLIDIRGIVVYTIQFIMGSGYSGIEKEIEKLLSSMEDYTSVSHNAINTTPAAFSIRQLNSNTFSVFIPNEGFHSVEVFNMRGTRILSMDGYGTTAYDFKEPISAGKYLIRIMTDKQTIVKPMIMRK